MKRLICIILMAMMVCNPFTSITVEATIIPNEEIVSSEIEYLDNGDMIVTTISCYTNGMTTMASYQTKTATKKKEYFSADGDILWSVSVRGSFRYNYGVSCECTSATGSSELIASGWSLGDVSSSKSGNTATASVSGTRYFLFVPLETITLSTTLTCSNTGVLS